MSRAFLRCQSGPLGLRQGLRWRRTVRWARAGVPSGGRRFSDPYEQIIDTLVRQWVGEYRVWDVFTAPAAGERAQALEICHAWRMVRGEGLAWRFEVRDLPTGQWRQVSAEAWRFASFTVWPFHAVRERHRARAVGKSLVALLVEQAGAHVRQRLGLAPTRRLGRWDGSAVRVVRGREWQHPVRGWLRPRRVEPAMRVFMAALWQQALDPALSGAMAAIHGFSGYNSATVWTHLGRPERLLAWQARPNLRPLLAYWSPTFWPTPERAEALFPGCAAAQREAAMAAPSRMLAAAGRLEQGGARFAYWSMDPRVRRRLDDLPLPDRIALVGWCAAQAAAKMPLPLMESLVLAHRQYLLRALDAGQARTRTGEQAHANLRALEAATDRLAGRTPSGVRGRLAPRVRWPAVHAWPRRLEHDHPWRAQARADRLRRALPGAGAPTPRGRL